MAWPVPVKKQLLALPRGSGTWQVGTSDVQFVMRGGREGYLSLCVQGDGVIRSQHVSNGPPLPADLAKLLQAALAAPIAPGRPGLPARIQCTQEALLAMLTELCTPLKIAVVKVEVVPALQEVLADLSPDLAQGGRTTVASLERELFAAAAAYALLRPWQLFCEEPEFHLETTIAGWSHPAAVVMGGLGETFGLAIFRSAAALQAHRENSDALGPKAAAGKLDSLSITLHSGREIPAVERTRAKAKGFEVARGWFPMFTCTQPGRTPTDLHATADAQAVIACLRGVAGWVQRSLDDSRVPLDATLALNGYDLRCRLANPESFVPGQWDDVDSEDDDADDGDTVASPGRQTMRLPVLTRQAVAVGFLRAEPPDEVRRQWQAKSGRDFQQIPLIALTSNADGIRDLDAALRGTKQVGVLEEDDSFALLALDGPCPGVLARFDEPLNPMPQWKAAAAAIGNCAMLCWRHGDGSQPVMTWQKDGALGERGVQVDFGIKDRLVK